MRHLRILAACLAAAFALSATALVVAGPALARTKRAACNEECHKKKEEEKAQKKREKEEKKKKQLEEKEAKKCEKLPACKKAKEEIKQKEEEIAEKEAAIGENLRRRAKVEEELRKLGTEKKAGEEHAREVREELEHHLTELKEEEALLNHEDQLLREGRSELEVEQKRDEKEEAAAKSVQEAYEKERATVAGYEEKDEGNDWGKLANCPLEKAFEEARELPYLFSVEGCTWGESEPGSEFTAGKVHVNLINPIKIQGLNFEGEEEGSPDFVYEPEDGAPFMTPVAQPAPPLNEDVNEAMLSPAEKKIYQRLIAEGRTATTVSVELAGTASLLRVSLFNLIEERGTALQFPLKIKLSSPFVGSHCYVGSNEHPVMIHLTTGTSGGLHGHFGSPSLNPEGTIILDHSTVVDNEYASPGVEGCGKDASVDEAMDAALGLPSPSGSNDAIVVGSLEQTGETETLEGFAKYGIPVT